MATRDYSPPPQSSVTIATWLRVLLWLVVALVPGGLLLLPLLIGDEVRRRKQLPNRCATPT